MLRYVFMAAAAATIMTVSSPAIPEENLINGDLVVIVNSGNSINRLSRSDLEKIFLGKRGFWEWGKRIKTVDLIEPELKEEDTSRAVFSHSFLNRNLAALKSYWIIVIFSGKGQPPLTFGKPEDVINFVSGNQEAIGYVRKEDFPGENMKVAKVVIFHIVDE